MRILLSPAKKKAKGLVAFLSWGGLPFHFAVLRGPIIDASHVLVGLYDSMNDCDVTAGG